MWKRFDSLPPADVPTLSGIALLLLVLFVATAGLRKLRHGGGVQTS